MRSKGYVVWFLFPVMLCLSLGNPGCKKESPVGPSGPKFPTLTDPIPFGALGMGKLVFERIGPFSNNYQGVYVLDVGQQRSSGFDGIFDGPSISPDGKQIAFAALTSIQSAYDIYVIGVDGTNRQLVAELVGQDGSPSWTYNGKQILFHSTPLRSPLFTPIYRQSPVPNPSDRTKLIDFGEVDYPNIYFPDGPVSAAPNGKLVVSTGEIWTMDGGGTNLKLVLPRPANGERFYSPAWSPDGNNVALLSIRRDSLSITDVTVLLYPTTWNYPDTLVSLSASGKGEWAGNNNYSLCWSPDGSQIAFTRPDGVDVGAHIYLIKKDGTGLTQVTFADGVTDRSLSWSQ